MEGHQLVGQPPQPGAEVNECWALIATHPNGGEGVYGHKVGSGWQQFVAWTPAMKDTMESFLRNRGTINNAREEGVKLEWRPFIVTNGSEEIT